MGQNPYVSLILPPWTSAAHRTWQYSSVYIYLVSGASRTLLSCRLQPELRKHCWSPGAEDGSASHPATFVCRARDWEEGRTDKAQHPCHQPWTTTQGNAWRCFQAKFERLYVMQQLQLGAEHQLSCFIHPNCLSPLQKSTLISSLENLFNFLLFSPVLQCSHFC